MKGGSSMYAVQLHCLMLHPLTNEVLGDQTITVEVEQLNKQTFIRAARQRLGYSKIRLLSYRLVGTIKNNSKREGD